MVKGLKCNQPVKSWRKGKKLAVKACDKGKEKILHFGAKGMSDYTIHKDYDRMLNFRARHGCDKGKLNPLTPKAWACDWLWPKKRLK